MITKTQSEYNEKIETLKQNDTLNMYCIHIGCIESPEVEDFSFPHCYVHNPLHKGNQTDFAIIDFKTIYKHLTGLDDIHDIHEEEIETIVDIITENKKELQKAQSTNIKLRAELAKLKPVVGTKRPSSTKSTPPKQKRAKPYGTKCKQCNTIFGATCNFCKEDICEVCDNKCLFCK